MKLARAMAMVVVASGCRGGSSSVEREPPETRRPSPAARPAAKWQTPRLAWRVSGVDILSFAAGGGAAVFPSESGRGLLAVDLASGRRRWEIEVADLVPHSLVVSDELAVFSRRSGEVTAVALADGARRWSTDLGCAFAWPAAGDGLVAGACDALTGRPVRHAVAAVDLATGARRIRLDVPDGLASAPGIDGRAVYFARSQGQAGVVIAVDRASGRERWRTALPQPVSAARVVGDVVVARGFDTFGLRAADGRHLWRAETRSRTSFWLERSVVVHGRLIAHPRDGAVDGLDARTGKVAATWTVPPVAASGERPMNGLWEVGDRLVAHMLGMGAPGYLVVWSAADPQLLATPPGVVNAIADDTVLQTMGAGDGGATVRGLLLAGEVPGDPVVTRAASPTGPDDCETDDYEPQGAVTLDKMKDGISARAMLLHRDHLYWSSRKGVVWRMPLAGGAPEEVGEIQSRRLLAIDDEYFYWAECGTGGCGHHGENQALVRVSRADRTRSVLADRLGIVHVVALDGGEIYLGTWDDDHGARGSVARVSRKGGALATLWRGGAVEDLLVDRDRIFAVARDQVVSIPRGAGKPVVVASGLEAAHAVAIDGGQVYIAVRGDPYWQSADSGYLVRAPRGGGKAERLLGPVRWPEGVAVIGDRILVGLARGDILSVAKTGGQPAVLVREKRSDPCRATYWMRATGGALYWLRAVHIQGGRGILWRLRP
ncbi:MAG TPA: PQQ-binding-like beta-propeller repeat protein [Kofleriaceae bacterium]|nr:PQQ-binding-like beta-propeller repeat protein [Kofleriaceae bacterium]